MNFEISQWKKIDAFKFCNTDCVTYFSIAVLKHCDPGNLQKEGCICSLPFQREYPSTSATIVVWKHGSKQASHVVAGTAKGPHPYQLAGNREKKLEMLGGFWCTSSR